MMSSITSFRASASASRGKKLPSDNINLCTTDGCVLINVPVPEVVGQK